MRAIAIGFAVRVDEVSVDWAVAGRAEATPLQVQSGDGRNFWRGVFFFLIGGVELVFFDCELAPA